MSGINKDRKDKRKMNDFFYRFLSEGTRKECCGCSLDEGAMGVD